MTLIKENLAAVELQISQACLQANRPRHDVCLLAVSKTKTRQSIEQAYLSGQRCFGESYIQEAVDKVIQLTHLKDLQWHFIGPIQSNKTKQIATHFSWVHSIDRAKLITRLNEHRCSQDTPLNVCLQVNISGEASKSGIDPREIEHLAQLVESCDNLCLRGVMAIPKKNDSQDSFIAMHSIFKKLQQHYPSVDTLSMGMSGDLNEAIANGSTMIRVGTAIFGKRTS
jgi:hypothetical protein